MLRYRLSKFNYYHKCENGELLLYSSAQGTSSISRVLANKSDSIAEILKRGSDNNESEDIKFLLERGFIVLFEENEDTLRKLRTMEQVMDSTLHLIILPTEQCNFRCKYCYETFKKGKMEEAIQESIVKYVRKNIHKYTGLYDNWFGGEPLEALDVVERLSEEFQKICKFAKKPYSAGMTTNGYDLTIETYKKLYKLAVYNYQITVDGLEEEHDKQRVLTGGQGIFANIIGNLLDIKNRIRNFNASFIIRTNFTKQIFDDIERFLAFYSKTFNDDARFNFYIHMASDWGGERVSAFSNEILSESQYRDIIRSIINYGIQLNYDSHYSHLNYQSCICYASRRNSIVIGSDATLYKCTGDFEFEKNNVGKLTLNGELQYNQNYDLWLGGIHEVEDKCKNCFYGACCLSNNCPAVRVRELSNDTCSFEKENLGLFLELFSKNHFSVLGVCGYIITVYSSHKIGRAW